VKLAKFFFSTLLLMSLIIPARSVHAHVATFALLTASAANSPTTTSLLTSTPSITPSATLTPVPTQMPVVITVVHTKIVTVVPDNSTPEATATNTITSTPSSPEEKETGNRSPLSIAIVGMVATFIGGLVVGLLWSNWRKR
jgi:hypothetical protein